MSGFHDGEIARNKPCPCGSSHKYIKCCYAKDNNLASQALGGDIPVGDAPKEGDLVRAPFGPRGERVLCVVTARGTGVGGRAGMRLRPIWGEECGQLTPEGEFCHARPEDWAKLHGLRVCTPPTPPPSTPPPRPAPPRPAPLISARSQPCS